MEQKVLNAQLRTETGKGVAGRLRRAGRIPAVVYGHEDPQALSLEAREFNREFHTVSESTLIALSIGKTKKDVLIKDYVEDIRTGDILHIDFYEIERGKKLHTRIAIELVGSPKGVREGGVLEHSLHEVEIECLPKDLPEHLTADVSDLEQGQSLHVSDIALPDGVRILNSPEQTIAAVTIPRATVEDTEDEAEALAAPAAEVAADPE
jgi:large subunit ribosomal protein L25